jgi:hypothetical protein
MCTKLHPDKNAIKTVFAALVLPGKEAKKMVSKNFDGNNASKSLQNTIKDYFFFPSCRHFYLVTGINGTSPN